MRNTNRTAEPKHLEAGERIRITPLNAISYALVKVDIHNAHLQNPSKRAPITQYHLRQSHSFFQLTPDSKHMFNIHQVIAVTGT